MSTWIVEEYDMETKLKQSSPPRISIFDDCCEIAKVNDQANARLIAAAPDMLEALERIVNECADRVDFGPLGQATIAIAKAKGINLERR